VMPSGADGLARGSHRTAVSTRKATAGSTAYGGGVLLVGFSATGDEAPGVMLLPRDHAIYLRNFRR
jgi:hypothetical protein